MKKFSKSFFIAHILMIALLMLVNTPGQKSVVANTALLSGIAVIELIYLSQLVRNLYKNKSILALSDLMVLVWGFMLLWEIFTTQLNLMHPVLVPSPEDVCNVFASQYKVLLTGVASSMQLLLIGFLFGISLGVGLGLPVGWIPRLRDIFYPMASVLTPIPPVVFAPYLIALMPTFRSASAVVIFLGIFWPTFFNTIIRVNSIERRILDSARVLNVSNATMIRKILLPYLIPGVVSGLKVTMTTSVMMLTFAEMMGATSGMGFYIINYTHYANYTNVVAGIILVGIVVTILNWLVNLVQTKTIKWY
jgi:NitT/TauT family transport system permease protein